MIRGDAAVKFKLLISALIAALLVLDPVAHAATHEVVPDSTHEFVECYGCSVAVAAVEETDKHFQPRAHETYNHLSTRVVLATRFNSYSPRAPPAK